MPDYEKYILERMTSRVFKEHKPVWFVTDDSGLIRHWGGNLGELNLAAPETGKPVSDLLIFMEGILPLDGYGMDFSAIQMPPDLCLDAHVFRMGGGWGLVVWDTTQNEAALSRSQQKCNELSLMVRRYEQQIDRQKKENPILGELFRTLNMVVLEMDATGRFVLLDDPPPWIRHIPGSDRLLAGRPHEEDVFSFLGNFIQEAKDRWNSGDLRSFKSGAWIEQDENGQELIFDAMAADVQGKKMILLRHDACTPHDTQAIIQKGRNLALNFHDLKRSDRKLKTMHDALEVMVKERTEDLRAANEKLAAELKERERIEKEREKMARQLRQSQKMEAIGTLAGGIAHDFNNILSAIIGFTELSLLSLGENNDLADMQQKILVAANRAKELVRQILTFSRQTEQEKMPLRLKTIVAEVLELLRASIPASIEIDRHLKSSAYILADATQIHQVVMNLCTNAWYAMEEGGTLSVSLADVALTPDDLKSMPELMPGPHALITISDTGCGMPPDILDRIFDPYFTTREKDKGTGLGLSVVHGIVAKTKGAIRARSTPGQGSTFTLYFPAMGEAEPAQIFEPQFRPGSGQQILFVDDEPLQTQIAEAFLSRRGYRVVTCNDSLEALRIFTDAPDQFHLVITDLIMPKLSGNTLAEKIRSRRPDLPIIFCTGYSEDLEEERLKVSGIRQVLMKPVGIRDLARAVEAALKA